MKERKKEREKERKKEREPRGIETAINPIRADERNRTPRTRTRKKTSKNARKLG